MAVILRSLVQIRFEGHFLLSTNNSSKSIPFFLCIFWSISTLTIMFVLICINWKWIFIFYFYKEIALVRITLLNFIILKKRERKVQNKNRLAIEVMQGLLPHSAWLNVSTFTPCNEWRWSTSHSEKPSRSAPWSSLVESTQFSFDYCIFTNFRCVKISVASDRGPFGVVYFKYRCLWMLLWSRNVFFAFRCLLFNFGKTIDHRKYRN